MNKPIKIDLTILKRLTTELEASLLTAEKIAMNTAITSNDKVEYIVEMTKASGFSTGVMQEAMMLVGDIQHAMTGDGPSNYNAKELLNKVMGGYKGSGGAN